MNFDEARARRIERECYDLAALEREFRLPVPPPPLECLGDGIGAYLADNYIEHGRLTA